MKNEDVLNQPPPLVDYNLYEINQPLKDAVKREGAGWAEDRLQSLGKLMGTAEVIIAYRN